MNAFANTLKTWRKARRLSQLGLAMEADVSSRHISFLESGRSQPSRDMIDKLVLTLDMPLAAANQMMVAAGFAPKYNQRSWEDTEMAPVRAALEHMLNSHNPYPAFAVDHMWRLVKLNKSAEKLFAPLGLAAGASILQALESDLLPAILENWPQVAHHSAHRLRTESMAMGGIAEFDRIAAKLIENTEEVHSSDLPVIPAIYRIGDTKLSLFSTIAQFGTPHDLTLDNLKIELFFPADEETEMFLRALDAA